MKPILLTAVLLFNYLFDNIKVTFSEKTFLHRIVFTSTVMQKKEIVLIDFSERSLSVDQTQLTSDVKQAKTNKTIDQPLNRIVTESWMLFGTIF